MSKNFLDIIKLGWNIRFINKALYADVADIVTVECVHANGRKICHVASYEILNDVESTDIFFGLILQSVTL